MLAFIRRLFSRRKYPEVEIPIKGLGRHPTRTIAASEAISHALKFEPNREVAGIITECRSCEDEARYQYTIVKIGGTRRVRYEISGEAVAHFHTHPGVRDDLSNHSKADRRIVSHRDPYRRPSFVGNGTAFWRLDWVNDDLIETRLF